MNFGGKGDLDALLKSWPAPLPKGMAAGDGEERGWEERADAIVRAAGSARDDAAKAKAEALFEVPALSPEAGEEAAVTAVGEKKMSQEEKESVDSPVSAKAPMSTVTPVPSERKRTSLKEIAARASQAGAARLSSPGAAPPSTAAPSVRQSAPPPSSAVRPTEAGKDDSGVINLQVVHATATAAQVAAAEKAKPAQAGLFDEDKTAEPAKPAAAAAAAAAAPSAEGAKVVALPQKKSNAGLIGGIAIAAIGIAAAFAIMSKSPPPPPAPVAAEKAPTPPPAPTQVAAAPTQAATAEPAPTAAATTEPDTKVAEAPKNVVPGPMPTSAGAATAAPTAAATVAKSQGGSGKPGDLQSEMIKAVGKDGQPKADQSVAMEPAAGGPKNQNIPEQPSQGAVAAAFNPVMGSAKACVAGADDVSRASVTFSSGGSVTSVSVSGWAAANGKSGCVQAALKAAKVNPFSKPSFTVGVPIRP